MYSELIKTQKIVVKQSTWQFLCATTICSSSELVAVLVSAFCEAEPETRIVYLGGDPLKQG